MSSISTSTRDTTYNGSIKDITYNGSIKNIYFGSQKGAYFSKLSTNNLNQIKHIQSFGLLNKNWNSYNAEKPSLEAIIKAISFCLWLSERDVEIFFVSPTPDGDILLEVKNDLASLEFIFSSSSNDKILAWCDGDLMQEAYLNDTTRNSYLKWLICPDGNCPDLQ